MLEETACKKGHFRDEGNEKRRATALFEDWTSTNPIRILHGDASSISQIGSRVFASRAVVSAIYNIAAAEYLHYETAPVAP